MGIEKSRLRQTNKPNVKHREIMTAEESKELSEWKPQHIKANPSHPNSPKSCERRRFPPQCSSLPQREIIQPQTAPQNPIVMSAELHAENSGPQETPKPSSC